MVSAKGKDLRYQHEALFFPHLHVGFWPWSLFLVPPFWNFLLLGITYQTGCGECDESQILLFLRLPPVHSFRMEGLLGGSNRSFLTGALSGIAVNPVCCCCSTSYMNWVRKPQHSLLESWFCYEDQNLIIFPVFFTDFISCGFTLVSNGYEVLDSTHSWCLGSRHFSCCSVLMTLEGGQKLEFNFPVSW